jgi:hypothetical protein
MQGEQEPAPPATSSGKRRNRKMKANAEKITRLVPVRFYDDHEMRDLSEGAEIIAKKGHRYLVEFTPAALAELRSDADYYATGFTGEDAAEIRGLIASARATLRALDDQAAGL